MPPPAIRQQQLRRRQRLKRVLRLLPRRARHRSATSRRSASNRK